MVEGHRAGILAIERVIDACLEHDIKFLSLFAFSTENWSRRREEVDYLLELMDSYLTQIVTRRLGSERYENVDFRFIGDLTRFPSSIQRSMKSLQEKDKSESLLTAVFAVNYGGRDEILRALEKLSVSNKPDISVRELEQHLDTRGIPDPDLVVRTSGVKRVSNFMIWQTAYSEWHFLDKSWPEISGDDVGGCVDEYHGRDRRFGA